MKKLLLLGFAVFVLAGCTAKTLSTNNPSVLSSKPASSTGTTQAPASTSNGTKNQQTISAPNASNLPAGWPKTLELKVPFAPQAPFGNWDAVHEETCEEASMIMANEYVKGQTLGDQTVEDELQKLLTWENEKGYSVDLTTAEAVKVLSDYFGIKARIVSNVTVERIKSELIKGNLLILPAAGRELKNPNFKAPGPIYHMLVVKGYDTSNFITNDPGTRKGNGYKYPYQTLIGAVHDWNPVLAKDGMTDAEMTLGAKVMIIIDKP